MVRTARSGVLLGAVAIFLVVGATTCTPGTTPPPPPSSPLLAYPVAQNAARVDIFGTTPPGVGTPLTWVSLPETSVSVTTATSAVVLARFVAEPACFGTGCKYARRLLDGGQLGTVPLAALPPATPDQSEVSAAIEQSVPVPAGMHQVTVETAIDSVAPARFFRGLTRVDGT